ncbi:hypothetical protein B1B_08174 [mine drainage metagenome]|uniref:Thioredoxin domain-containing protein n=1 Tax=mine drainage metagenome TaxID=410659 RepID=T1ASL6_9ZZZZ
MKFFNKEDFQYFFDTCNKLVVFYGSGGCGHCRNILPLYRELSEKCPNVTFTYVESGKLKIDNLEGIPHFVLYYKQNCISDFKGANSQRLTAEVSNLAYM